jgi:hypothetical protein
MRGAAVLSAAATPLALHPALAVRAALCAAAPALAARRVLLDGVDGASQMDVDGDEDRAVVGLCRLPLSNLR